MRDRHIYSVDFWLDKLLQNMNQFGFGTYVCQWLMVWHIFIVQEDYNDSFYIIKMVEDTILWTYC